MRLGYLMVLSTAMLLPGAAASAGGYATEAAFYRGVSGTWQGPGEIVAGKYKGTRFTCQLNGDSNSTSSFAISGSCRVGVFSQPINASVTRAGGRMAGKFLDGEAGDGMDVVGGRYSAQRLTVDVKRHDLIGVMSARLAEEDKLNVTISVKVGSRLIPVIGMSLDRRSRTDAVVTSSID